MRKGKFADTAESLTRLQSAWPSATKEYLVLVRGKPESRAFTIDRPLTDRGTRLSEDPVKAAVTQFSLVRTYFGGGLSLLRATLVLGGRTHQIRRHLDRAGHQVVGDRKYGKSRINSWLERDYGLRRICLHAERLVVAELGIEVVDALPQDITVFLRRLPE